MALSSEKDNVFSIYPNPTKDYLYIRSKNIDVLKIDVFDILGKKIYSKKDDMNQLAISNLKCGILFMEIETERGTITKRIIKV